MMSIGQSYTVPWKLSSTHVRVAKLLENTIYSEASKIFGHCTIFLKKKFRNSQISSIVDPQEQASLRELLAPINDKIRSFRHVEKHRKKGPLFKKFFVHVSNIQLCHYNGFALWSTI